MNKIASHRLSIKRFQLWIKNHPMLLTVLLLAPL
jgi:hypothetical protein